MITIGIADDHALVRQGLRMLLERENGFHVVGEAENGGSARKLVQELKPDVLVLDVSMPGEGGLDMLPELKVLHPHMRVIMLSMHDHECYVTQALRKGADGYALKEANGSDLIRGIRQVASGGRRYLSPSIGETVMDALLGIGVDRNGAGLHALTTREQEVLWHTIDGLCSAKIAHCMSISPRTVEAHRANLMRKLGVHTRTGLVRHVLEHGLLMSMKGKTVATSTRG